MAKTEQIRSYLTDLLDSLDGDGLIITDREEIADKLEEMGDFESLTAIITGEEEPEDATKEIIPCVCLTCGVRNDFSHPNGFCQNGHDDWFEFRDLNDPEMEFQRKRATEVTGLPFHKFLGMFMSKGVTQFPIVKSVNQ